MIQQAETIFRCWPRSFGLKSQKIILTQRAEKTKIIHLQTAFDREKSRADLMKSDMERIETELRDERRMRRAREQKQEIQVQSLQKQIDSHGDVTTRLKESKDRTNSRLEQEASRAHELEKRLKMSQNEATLKSEQIKQLQGQLASALSSDMELTYEDLQKLIVSQKNADDISATILSIMNKTRSILSQKTKEEPQALRDEVVPSKSRTPVAVPPGMSLETNAALKTVFSQQDLVVLIDGYNVSLNSFGNLSLELQRDRVVACASSIETRFHTSCLIVFDGQSAGTRGRIQSKVHVVFSPTGVTADDIIIERIRVTPKDKPILVVTSDRNLAARAKGLGCETISSESFVEVAK